jgi:ribonucleoside-diphosphate reductase alpha chain
LIENYGANPDDIETAQSLSQDYKRRIKFQADVQDYVDMAISSTINLPQFSESFDVRAFARTLAKYAPRLRGLTCYPDGSRGGQPLTTVPYREAVVQLGKEFEEHLEANDPCEGGVCGV